MAPSKLPRRPKPPSDSATAEPEDDLGAGVAPEESSEEVQEEAPPFAEDYVPRTMGEATQLEQWRGRLHARQFALRHEAELEAGRQTVIDEAQRVVDRETRTLEAQIADAEAEVGKARAALELAEINLLNLEEDLYRQQNAE